MSGHAGHKGTGVKHSHDSGQLDSAATMPESNPEDILPEGEGYPFDAQGEAEETEVNPAALERPQEPPVEQQQS
jgi:hypothetical protein